MVPWEALIAYALINVAAALFAWLPFRLLDRISLVDQIDTTNLEYERPVAIPASRHDGRAEHSSDDPGQRL